jgi:hypothetical protein
MAKIWGQENLKALSEFGGRKEVNYVETRDFSRTFYSRFGIAEMRRVGVNEKV